MYGVVGDANSTCCVHNAREPFSIAADYRLCGSLYQVVNGLIAHLTSKSIFPCESHVIFVATPSEVFDTVICLDIVYVIYGCKVFRIWDEGFCHESMYFGYLAHLCAIG